ncbi:MAG TPA: hypothetical protein VF088_07600 [Pyrinomonadaceae bacterium]
MMLLLLAGNYDPDLVLGVCSQWATLHSANTNSIIRDGLRKLKTTRVAEVERILSSLRSTATA